MSVLLETSKGDIVIDLFVDEAPKCCEKYVPPKPSNIETAINNTPMIAPVC